MPSKAELVQEVYDLEQQLVKVKAEYEALKAKYDALVAQRGFVYQPTAANVSVQGGTPTRTAAYFKALPTVQIDRTKPFPQTIGGIRAQYFVGPGNATLEYIQV